MKNVSGYEIINLGNSNPIEVKYLINLLEKQIGKKANINLMPIQSGDVTMTHADISKAKSLLNWEPKVKIEEGVKDYVTWFKEYYFPNSSAKKYNENAAIE
jgi:UDP-glucuronate 4-epimerase